MEQPESDNTIPQAPYRASPLVPSSPPEVLPKHASHTYDDDLANAMDTTDASVIQEMIARGKECEENAKEAVIIKHQKGWYRTGATLLIICALGALGYGAWNYRTLTVPAAPAATVGVFPSSAAIVSSETDIRTLITSLSLEATLPPEKPALIPLVTDRSSLTLLTPAELFSFFETKASEPLVGSFDLIRLGAIKTQAGATPFIIGSINNTEVAAKELLIAEPLLLSMLYRPLGIDLSTYTDEIGRSFVGEYLYNIPVRSLRVTDGENTGALIFFYARVTDDIILFTTSPDTLKAVYESIIRQR